MKSAILRKIIAGSMAIAMVAGTGVGTTFGDVIGTSITASAADTLTEGDFEYQINDAGTVTLVKYNGSDTEVTVPSKIGDVAVEVIGAGTFRNSKTVTKVTLPSTIKTIANDSFRDSVIETVNLPSSLTEIGNAAFYNCVYLKNVTFPSTLTTIGSSAFEYCSRLTKIALPTNLSSLGNNAFRLCTGVTSVTLSNTCKTIPSSAFAHTQISSITIPDAVEEIGDYAFYNCRKLTKVNFGTNSNLTRIHYEAFYDCAALPSFTCPAALQYIDGYAFYNCVALGSITFNAALRGISYNAFMYCRSLKEVDFPAGLEYIDSNSFNGCTSLETVKTNGLQTIGNSSFKDCTALKSVYFGDGLKRINNEAFYNTPNLTNFYDAPQRQIYLEDRCLDASGWFSKQPEGVVYFGANSLAVKGGVKNAVIKAGTVLIDNKTFKASTGVKSVHIPSTVKDIDFRDVFDACGNTLEAITFDADHEQYQSIDGVVYSKDGKTLIYCPRAKKGTIDIPDTVTKINGRSIINCNSITTVNLGVNVSSFDQYDFCYMSSLEAVNVPAANVNFTSVDGVLYNKTKTYLYDYPNAKKGAYTMPDTLQSVYYYAFSEVTGLTELNLSVTMKDFYPSYYGKKSPSLSAINVDKDNQWYTSVDGILYNKDKTTLYIVPENKKGAYTIPDTVTRIDGEYTFRNCTGITTLTIPASVTTIGDSYFDNCPSVSKFVVSEDNTVRAAVNGCLMNTAKDYIYAFPKGAATVTLPESIVSCGRIRDAATNNCPNLVTLNLSSKFNNFDSYSKFANCPKFTTLKAASDSSYYTTVDGILYDKRVSRIIFVPGGKSGDYTVPATVTDIYDYSFKDATKLTSITFPKNFTSTFNMAEVMQNCNSLTAMNFDASNINYTSIDGVVYSKDVSQLYYVPNGKTGSYTVPETVTTIQNNRAFKNCSNLEEIIFPSGVTKLNFEVTNLNSLKAMTVPASVTEINNGFQNCNDLVISGYENSYAELFASYYDVKFNKLANSISLNKNYVETSAGKTVKLTASIDTSRTTNKTIKWTSSNTNAATVAADGTVKGVGAGFTRISATLSDGKTAVCDVFVADALQNTSTVSADTIIKGKSVTLDGAAAGGIKGYQYSMLYKLTSASSWTTLSAYSTTASATFTPEQAGTFDLCIKVKDKEGTEVKKFFTLTVNNAIANNSSVIDNAVTLGETVVILGSSTGGNGSVTYKYEQKLSTVSTWTTIADYSAKNAAVFKPTATGTYNIRVTAKDGNGTTAAKTINVTVGDVLANTSSLSADKVNLGETVTINASATGGSGSYTFAYYSKEFTQKSWSTISGFGTNATASFTAKTAGYYQICVKVKDADGTVAKEYYNVVVGETQQPQNEFKNTSTVGATQIKLGERVSVSAAAEGGKAPYTYAVLYKKTTDTTWTTKQNFSSNSETSVLPSKAADYEICVKAKDADGVVAEKTFNVKVVSNQNALQNNSTIASDKVVLGNSLTVNAKAAGGAGDYTYAVLYKKTTDTSWVTKQNFTTNTTVTVKPSNVAAYDLCVKVKDADGTIVKKFFTFNTVAGVTNTSTVNGSAAEKSTISFGGDITMKGSATGGTSPYTYAFYYKKSSEANWVEKQKFAVNNTVSITPNKAVDYDICIKVQDSNGIVEKKYFTVTVK